jgi:hypothetical protein
VKHRSHVLAVVLVAAGCQEPRVESLGESRPLDVVVPPKVRKLPMAAKDAHHAIGRIDRDGHLSVECMRGEEAARQAVGLRAEPGK